MRKTTTRNRHFPSTPHRYQIDMIEGNYTCRICKNSFTRREHLQRHVRSHKRERPFTCKTCGKSFGRKDLLTRHAKSAPCGRGADGPWDSDNRNATYRRHPPRCRVACQACISSKCRCVRVDENDVSCERCAKRNIPCISRASDNETGPRMIAEESSETVSGEPASLVVTEVPGCGPGALLAESTKNESKSLSAVNGLDQISDVRNVEKTSPLSISALVTPNDILSESTYGSSITDTVSRNGSSALQESLAHPALNMSDPTSVSAAATSGVNGGADDQGSLVEPDLRLLSHDPSKSDSAKQSSELPLISEEPNDSSLIGSRELESASTLASFSKSSAPRRFGVQTGVSSPDVDSNLRSAFSYSRAYRSLPQPDDELKMVDKFDLDGIQNSIKNVMDFANRPIDSTADILESWIASKQADVVREINFEEYFDHYSELDLSVESPVSAKGTKPGRDSGARGERRDSRATAFASTSISWRSPSEDGSSKDLRSFGEPELHDLSFLGNNVDKNSERFRTLRVLPKTRDAIMLTLSDTHHAQFWGDSSNVYLPSSDELTLLLMSYFENFHSKYHIIHLPTFDVNNEPITLLIAMIAAGSLYSNVSNEALVRVGRYFFEIGRRRIILQFEGDNSNITNLGLQQANVIVLITGSWSGVDRNVELSQSFVFTIATMIRRRDSFKANSYRTLQEILDDPNLLTPDSKWRSWILSENRKLLVYVMYYWSSQFSIIFNFPFCINYVELELPLPHMEPLWRCSNAEDWMRLVGLLRSQSPQQLMYNVSFSSFIGSVLSSKEFAGPLLSSKYFPDIVIGNLIATVSQFIVEHNDRVAFTNSIPKISESKKRKRHALSLDATFHYSYITNRKAEIENMLEMVETFVSHQGPHRQISYKAEIEYSYVCLYSSIKDCMKLAGVDGESESKQTIPRLLSWYKKEDSRIAIWHCAQLLKLAQMSSENCIFQPYLPYLIFHASLILWTYGLLVNINYKFDKKRIVTSMSEESQRSIMFLTDDWNSLTDRFIQSNDLVPCLRSPEKSNSESQNESPVFLSSPESVMDLAIKINDQVSQGYLTQDISNILQSLRNCSRDIILS